MASGIACERIRMTTMMVMESCKMAANDALANRLTETCTLGLEHPSLILDIHVKVNCHLSKQGIS